MRFSVMLFLGSGRRSRSSRRSRRSGLRWLRLRGGGLYPGTRNRKHSLAQGKRPSCPRPCLKLRTGKNERTNLKNVCREASVGSRGCGGGHATSGSGSGFCGGAHPGHPGPRFCRFPAGTRYAWAGCGSCRGGSARGCLGEAWQARSGGSLDLLPSLEPRKKQMQSSPQWTDEFLHHFETMGGHRIIPGFLGGAK